MGTESNSNMIETRCVDHYSRAREEREVEKREERSGSVLMYRLKVVFFRQSNIKG